MNTALVGNMSEAAIQNTFVSMFNSFYPNWLVCLSLSGISLNGSPKERAMVMQSAKQAGLVNGLPDIQLALPDAVTLNLEWKRPDGKGVQSDDQKAVESKLHGLGHNYYVVNDIDIAFKLIADHTQQTDRAEQFSNFTAMLSQPTLSEPFLYFPEGTPTVDVVAAVEPYYHI